MDLFMCGIRTWVALLVVAATISVGPGLQCYCNRPNFTLGECRAGRCTVEYKYRRDLASEQLVPACAAYKIPPYKDLVYACANKRTDTKSPACNAVFFKNKFLTKCWCTENFCNLRIFDQLDPNEQSASSIIENKGTAEDDSRPPPLFPLPFSNATVPVALYNNISEARQNFTSWTENPLLVNVSTVTLELGDTTVAFQVHNFTEKRQNLVPTSVNVTVLGNATVAAVDEFTERRPENPGSVELSSSVTAAAGDSRFSLFNLLPYGLPALLVAQILISIYCAKSTL